MDAPAEVNQYSFAADFVPSMRYLALCDVLTAVELTSSHMDFTAADWNDKFVGLVESGIDMEAAGYVLMLFPSLVDFDIPRVLARDKSSVRWLNEVSREVKLLAESYSDKFIDLYVGSDGDKFRNLQSAGDWLFAEWIRGNSADMRELVSHIPTPKERHPELTTQAIENQSRKLPRFARRAGLDTYVLTTLERKELFGRLEGLDQEAADAIQAVHYAYYMATNEGFFSQLRTLGLRPGEVDTHLEAVVKDLPPNIKTYAGRRLTALYSALDSDVARVQVIVEACPEYLAARGGFLYLEKSGLVTTEEIQLIKYEHSLQRERARRNSREMHKKEQLGIAAMARLESEGSDGPVHAHLAEINQIFESEGGILANIDPATLLSQEPRLLEITTKQVRARIRALKRLVGTQTAQLMIADHPGYLVNSILEAAVFNMRLSVEQRAELSDILLSESNRTSRETVRNIRLEAKREKLRATLTTDTQMIRGTEAIRNVFTENGLLIDVHDYVQEFPETTLQAEATMAKRIGVLVRVVGAYRAQQFLSEHPEYLASQKVDLRHTELTDVEREQLRLGFKVQVEREREARREAEAREQNIAWLQTRLSTLDHIPIVNLFSEFDLSDGLVVDILSGYMKLLNEEADSALIEVVRRRLEVMRDLIKDDATRELILQENPKLVTHKRFGTLAGAAIKPHKSKLVKEIRRRQMNDATARYKAKKMHLADSNNLISNQKYR